MRAKQQHWARGLVDRLYQPTAWLTEPTDDTIVCRCEQVSAGTITAITIGQFVDASAVIISFVFSKSYLAVIKLGYSRF